MIQGLIKRWEIYQPDGQSDALAKSLRLHPLVGQILLSRGINEIKQAAEFLNPKLTNLHDPQLLPGITKAADRIVEALRKNQKIIIYGDYDVDGITATAILYHTLKAAQPESDIQTYIPHRIDEGYGLNTDAIKSLADHGAQLIISVDCGITADQPAAVAKQNNIDLIITDHHNFSSVLPDAWAIVHPRLHEMTDTNQDPYPFGQLCGAAVAYKLAWQIARTFCGSERVSDQFSKLLVDMLPLAGLATIADVVPLIGENRTIAYCGLGTIKHTPFEGLNALINAASLRDEKIDCHHAGYVLGPRLNACGRMGHADKACELLTTATGEKASQIANFLNTENEKRRATEREIFNHAKQMAIDSGYDNDQTRAIVLADPTWHAGVLGIVCSSMVETFLKPTVLLNTSNSTASGSARSIKNFNIHDAFDTCSSHLQSFGGHAMAAGLKLKNGNIDAFRDAFTDYANKHISIEDLTPLLTLDAQAELNQLTMPLCKQIQQLAPFGQSNPHPRLLIRNAIVTQQPSPLGREAKHIAIIVRQGDTTIRCVGWNKGELLAQLGAGMSLDLAVKPKINRFNGRENVELELLDVKIN